MKHIFTKEPSSFSIFINLVLLLLAIGAYVFVDQYLTATANQKIENIEKNSDGDISDEDAKKIANEKYLMAIATLTNTRPDMDKLYDQAKTTEITLTEDDLITKLNNFNEKVFTKEATASVIENYDEAINDNFTKDFIEAHIISPNGFIGNVNNEYYIVKDKKENYIFKEATFKVLNKTQNEMTFTVIRTNYLESCVKTTAAIPLVTCKDTKKTEESEFKLIKENDKWKVAIMNF